jgi:DNA replication protein DnaC
MTSETINLATLLELKLHGIREVLENRLSQARNKGLGYEEFLSMLLQDEAEYRRNTRVKRLLKRAAFRQPASLEEFDFTVPRGLDKKVLQDLGGGSFILEGINILILGPTGVGKSYLSSAIGNAACRSGHSTLFYRMNALIEQMLLARAKGTYLNLLRRLSLCDLLVLDDFGIKPLNPQQFQDLYDVLDERGEDKSTIVTSQVPVENWNEVITDPVTCEAVTDRLASRAIRLQMKGDSYRKRRRTKRA